MVAQVVVGQAEFADALVMTCVGATRFSMRCWIGCPRWRPAMTSPGWTRALLAAIPANARRGRFDEFFRSLLYGQPPLEPVHGVSIVHFVERQPFHPMRLHTAVDILLDGVVRTRGRMWVASQADRRTGVRRSVRRMA